MKRIILAILIIGGLIASGLFVTTFSTVDEQLAFGNCKFIKEGDVCSQYTQCVYEPNRDLSCIKGYRIVNASVGSPDVDISETGGVDEE